jgi:hypothetical protein
MKEEHLEGAVLREPLSRSLLRHLDLMAVVLAVGFMAAHLGGLVLAPPPQAMEARGRLMTAEAAARRAADGRQFAVAEATRPWRAEAQAFESLWQPIPIPPPPAWTSVPKALLERFEQGQENRIRLLAASDLRGTAVDREIRLLWNPHPDSNVAVDHWIVLRAVGGGSFTEIGRTRGPDPTYTDEGVLAGVSYSYRVVPVPASELVRARRPAGPPSAPLTIRSESDVEILLADADGTARTARLTIRKRQGDSWSEWTDLVPVGGEIGRLESSTATDFRTGYSLIQVTEREEERRIQRREPVFEPDGRVRLAGAEAVTEEVVDVLRVRIVTAELAGPGLPPQSLSTERPAEKE